MDKVIHSLDIRGVVDDIYITKEELLQLKNDQLDEETPINEFRGILEFDNNSQEILLNEVDDNYRYGSTKQDQGKIKLLNMKFVSSSDHLNETYDI